MTERNRADLDQVIGSPTNATRLRQLAPGGYPAAAAFWAAAFETTHLTPRMKELVLVALHASVSTVNESGIARHVQRAKAAGATEADILDVLLSIVGLGNHALYFAVPILIEELQARHKGGEPVLPPMRPDVEAIKKDFIATRGFWNEERDNLARLMPGYFKALSRLSMEPWKSGSLLPWERELIYISIDAAVTHMHADGLRKHIGWALDRGATRDQILEVFHLVSLVAMEPYVLGCQAVAATRDEAAGRAA
jgi:alkylhydroperoxidase/carboxymuconolactone decarboxylase family protein YurZ